MIAVIRFLLLVLPVILPFTGKAQLFSFPYYYNTNDSGATITRYVGNSTSLIIPNTINGLAVTVIGVNSFYNFSVNNYSSRLTSIVIPDSVVNISTNAFGNCTNLAGLTLGNNVTNIALNAFFNCVRLTNVTIPSNTVSIGANVFANCSKLTNVFLPSSLNSIGLSAFDNCSSLASVTVDPSNLVYSSVGGVLFNQPQASLIFCPQARIGSFTIPSGILAIQDQAFQNCYGLTGVIIPDTVTNMGSSTFQNCTSLTNVSIGKGIGSIGTSSFYSCASLVNILIPTNITSIGDQAFEYCGSLTSVTMPNSVTNTGNSTFSYCTNLVSATISTNVTTIGNNLFWWDSNLNHVTIPNGVVTIGTGAFGNGVGITSLIIPDSVTSIGAYAFNACPITSLVIGNSVTNIGQRAFLGCSALTSSVTIPKGVTYIGDYGLAVCFRVPAFFFQGDAPTLGASALWDDLAATAYYLPGTQGWTNTLGDIPAVLWNPVAQTGDGSFGFSESKFGFNVTGTINIPILIEATTNLNSGVWKQLQNCTVTNGSIYFRDANSSSFPSRIYRIRSP